MISHTESRFEFHYQQPVMFFRQVAANIPLLVYPASLYQRHGAEPIFYRLLESFCTIDNE